MNHTTETLDTFGELLGIIGRGCSPEAAMQVGQRMLADSPQLRDRLTAQLERRASFAVRMIEELNKQEGREL